MSNGRPHPPQNAFSIGFRHPQRLQYLVARSPFFFLPLPVRFPLILDLKIRKAMARPVTTPNAPAKPSDSLLITETVEMLTIVEVFDTVVVMGSVAVLTTVTSQSKKPFVGAVP